jgi:L-ascorbate metabolism protein UlaG (beta-lactamase superfamily)
LVSHREVAPWLNPRGLYIQTVESINRYLFHEQPVKFWRFAFRRRMVFGHPQVLWVIEGGGKRIIHCGDTLWHGYWWNIGQAYGRFDLAFLPINGFRQVSGRYIDSGVPMSLTSEQTVAAARILHGQKSFVRFILETPVENYFEVADPERRFIKSARQAGVPYKLAKPAEWID